MKKMCLFAAIVVALFSSTARASGNSDRVVLGYCTDEISNGIGNGLSDSNLKAAITFMPEDLSAYIGMEINAIEVGIFNIPVSDFSVWISTTKDGIAIAEQSANPVVGWNTVKLPTPYIITGEQIWIGYNLTSSASVLFPLGICRAVPTNSNANWSCSTESPWANLPPNVPGVWNIRAVVETAAAPFPAVVTAYTVMPAPLGALSADIKFTTPAVTALNTPLTAITKAEIFRNGTSVHVFESPNVNTVLTYTDIPTESGNHTYKVVCSNDVGTGRSAFLTTFVGRDAPKAPLNIVLTSNENNAILNWRAPTGGVNGGWIDASSLKYKITRLPDNVVVVDDLSALTFTDTSIEWKAIYSYSVQAKTVDGEGNAAISNDLIVGSIILPPYHGLVSAEDFKMWTVINVNGDVNADNEECTWRYSEGGLAAQYYFSDRNRANDWMISSSIKMVKNKAYRISYDYRCMTSTLVEKMKVTIGKGATVDAQSTVLKNYPSISNSEFKTETINFIAPESADFNIGFYAYSDPNKYYLAVKDLIIEPIGDKDLAATAITTSDLVVAVGAERDYVVKVTNTGNVPQSSYTVELVRENGTVLASKNFTNTIEINETIDCVIPYAVGTIGSIKIFGNVKFTDDEIPENNKTPECVNIDVRQGYTVSGKVVNGDGANVSGATVRITGFREMLVLTNDEGLFSISNVFAANEYTLTVTGIGYSAKSIKLNITDQDVDTGTITVNERALTPADVMASKDETTATVTWKQGSETRMYRYDDGVAVEGLGFLFYASDNSILGAVHRTPTMLKNMTWWTDRASGGPHEKVNVFVLDLDDRGEPTPNVLFSQLGVPNTDDQWTSFVFPTLVDCPRGFMIAIGSSDFVGLGRDSGTSKDYPFVPQANYYSLDYTKNEFQIGTATNLPYNLLIRAEGYEISKVGEAKVQVGYSVWRLSEDDKADETKWTLLTPTVSADLTYTDSEWGALPNGAYVYAVKSIYSNDIISTPAFSNMISKGMETMVTVNVTTNATAEEANGAEVKLTNSDGKENHVYMGIVEAGKAVFNAVWMGEYKVEVTQEGFVKIAETKVDFSTELSYTKNYELKEMLFAPYNLQIRETNSPTERIFKWNESRAITDGFEEHRNFTINSQGAAGWNYIDGDKSSTFIFQSTTFPGAGNPMAYIVFDPSQTTPPLQSAIYPDLQPHDGSKFLATFGAESSANMDYIISPQLSFDTDFRLSFWAKSYVDDFGLERMKVGYSITGREVADFTNWLTAGDYVEVPAERWTYYNFAIPAEAKYVTIECVSDKAFIFMIDDIKITDEVEETKALTQYEIYLNEKFVDMTTSTTYNFTDLTEGSYTAGVKAVYTTGESAVSTIPFTVTNVGVNDEVEMSQIRLYPNPVQNLLNVEGEYELLEIYNTSGQLEMTVRGESAINVEGLYRGVHVVKIHNNGVVQTIKIVK